MSDFRPNTSNADNNGINFIAYWPVILKYRKLIQVLVASAVVVAIVSSLFIKNTYRSETTIMSISSKSGGSLSSIGSQLGGLAAIAGMGLSGGLDDSLRFVIILRSRTLAENVIKSQNLLPILFKEAWDAKTNKWRSSDPKMIPSMEDAVLALNSKVTVTDDKKNKTIRIAAEFSDPETAAMVANAFVDQLQKFINENAFTAAKRNRIFIERQLEENKKDLLNAGKEINEFYKGNRVSAADAQVDVSVDQKRSSLTPESDTTNSIDSTAPQVKVDENVKDFIVSELLSKKAELDKKIEETKVVHNVPQQVYLTYLTMRRELLAKVNALLTTQYEMSKIEEAKEDLSFQVIDKAFPPEKRFKPNRSRIVIMTFITSIILSLGLALCLDYIQNLRKKISR